MAFSVSDFSDLVLLLREHPEWRAELRAQVMSTDLLELPLVVRQLAEAQGRTEQRVGQLAEAQRRTEQRLEQLAEAQGRTEQRLEQLAEAQGRTEQRLEQLAEAQGRTEERLEQLAAQVAALGQQGAEQITALTQQVAEQATALTQQVAEQITALTQQIAGLTLSTNALVNRVADFRGAYLEWHYDRRAGAYFSPLARRIRVVDYSDFADALDDAVTAGTIRARERAAALAADLVLLGRRREDQADVYIVVEVASAIHTDDVYRAGERAAILEKLGRPAIPVVAGEEIDRLAREAAESDGVWQVVDGHADPPPPRAP